MWLHPCHRWHENITQPHRLHLDPTHQKKNGFRLRSNRLLRTRQSHTVVTSPPAPSCSPSSVYPHRTDAAPAHALTRAHSHHAKSDVHRHVHTTAHHHADVRRRCTCLLYTSPSPRDGLLSRM